MKKKVGICILILILLSVSFTSIVNAEVNADKGRILARNQDGTFRLNNNHKKFVISFGRELKIDLRDGAEITIYGTKYIGPDSITIHSFYGIAVQFWSGPQHVPYEESRIFINGFGKGIN